MNILFVGDFRPAANYGSIATTECLLNMIYPLLSENDSLKIIDRRSYDRQTPIGGFSKAKISFARKIIRKVIPQNIRSFLYRGVKPKCLSDFRKIEHVPFLLSEYTWYEKKVLSGRSFERDLLEWSDFVFINGEGTIVKGTDRLGIYNRGGRYTIWMAYLAKQVFHKPTCLVNLTVDPGNLDAVEMIKHVFPKVDFLSTREPLSKNKLLSLGVLNANYAPDALFSYEPDTSWKPNNYLSSIIDFGKPYIVLGDSTSLNSNNYQDAVRWDIVKTYTTLYSKLKSVFGQVVFLDGFNGKNKNINDFITKNGIKPIRLQNTSYHDLYYVFAHSLVFISGRWHASVLATLSSTPILLYGADSHKTRALYSMVDYKYPFFETQTLPLHIDEILNNAIKIRDDAEIRQQIKEKVDSLRADSFKNIDYLKAFLHKER